MLLSAKSLEATTKSSRLIATANAESALYRRIAHNQSLVIVPIEPENLGRLGPHLPLVGVPVEAHGNARQLAGAGAAL
eukprot:11160286-Lingulodinium_polyedra.AAC.1